MRHRITPRSSSATVEEPHADNLDLYNPLYPETHGDRLGWIAVLGSGCMIVCRNCGAQSLDDSVNCQHCGLRIAPYTEEERRVYVQSLQSNAGDSADNENPPRDDSHRDMAMAICANCLYQGSPVTRTKGSFWIEVLLWTFILPGLIYTVWRLTTRERVCPKCEHPHMIPLDTPVGQRLAKHAAESTLPHGCELDPETRAGS